jgi:hypothetical protein
MIKSIALSVILLSLARLPLHAAPLLDCKHMDEAISSNEDFVEVALGIDDLPLPPALDTIKTKLKRVEHWMAPAAKLKASEQVANIEAKVKAGDNPAAAVAAIETYQTLIANFKPNLPTTYETAMLDYVGFKVLSLAAAQAPDWPELATTVALSHENWDKTKSTMKDQGVIDLVDSTHTALNKALAAKDARWLGSTAQTLLDSVDLIERQSKNPAKGACH